jgi:hypothetical protein
MNSILFTRRALAASCAAALLGSGLALFLPAPAAQAQSGAASVAPDQRAYWRDTAAELRARVAAAAVREQAATAAYSRMLTRRYPAGEAKAAIIDERDAAAKDLAEARAEVREFKQQARAAGVPDRWIDPEGQAPPWWIDPDS